jgi:hypothetical protein
VIAESTRQLLGNLFELNDLRLQRLKGLAAPAHAFAVVRPSSVETRFEALRATALRTLVGRDEEIEPLMRRWEQVKSRQGRVLLTGEPGIGRASRSRSKNAFNLIRIHGCATSARRIIKIARCTR